MAEIIIAKNRVAEPGEGGPAITLHSEEAAFDQAEDEGGVSVNVDRA